MEVLQSGMAVFMQGVQQDKVAGEVEEELTALELAEAAAAQLQHKHSRGFAVSTGANPKASLSPAPWVW